MGRFSGTALLALLFAYAGAHNVRLPGTTPDTRDTIDSVRKAQAKPNKNEQQVRSEVDTKDDLSVCGLIAAFGGEEVKTDDDCAAKMNAVNPKGIVYLIVDVPDPVRTHFALDFDRAVESISRAAEAEGYALDRFSFPW